MVFIVRDDEKLSRLEPAQKIIKAREFWAFKEAEQAVADAMQRHEEIVSAAKAAYEAEQRRGYDEGTQAAKLEQSSNMIRIVGETVQYFANVESRMVDLVLDAVQQVIKTFDDREHIATVVRNVLATVRSQKHLTVRVHPDHVDGLRAQLDELLAAYPAIECVDFAGDARMAPDACRVESDIGTVEASVSAQLEALRQTFKSVFASRGLSEPSCGSPSTTSPTCCATPWRRRRLCASAAVSRR